MGYGPSNPLQKRLKGKARICVITAGHLSTTPRMLKATEAFAEAGYDVTIVSTTGWAKWARKADEEIYAGRNREWRWVKVPWDRQSAPATWAGSAVRARFATKATRLIRPARLPLSFLGMAHIRSNPELFAAIRRQPCDLYYGGGSSLAATADAAARRQTRFGIDLEDFHSAELREQGRAGSVVSEIERRVLPRASFLTAGSEAIAVEYERALQVHPFAIHNTFPLADAVARPSLRSTGPLKFYWFSQTIGGGRGLEEAILAIGQAGVPAELHLRGQADIRYVQALQDRAMTAAANLRIFCHDPAPPDQMVQLAARYDIGLSLERSEPLNRDLCLTNKAFTYMLAGLAVVFTDTTAQRRLAGSMGEGAFSYSAGDPLAFSEQIRTWASDGDMLHRAKEAALEAARKRWHWEHEKERGVLLRLVEQALAS